MFWVVKFMFHPIWRQFPVWILINFWERDKSPFNYKNWFLRADYSIFKYYAQRYWVLGFRQQLTRVATLLSEPLTITHDVPQGSILGPTLFNLYMNYLPDVIKFSKIESYIDGTKI